jgi:deoxyribonuclease IV
MNDDLYVGAHASIAMGYEASMKSIDVIGGNAVQVFLKNPRGRVGKLFDLDEARSAKNYLRENEMFLVGHCSYLLNFAKDPKDFPWAVESLVDDMIRTSEIGGVGVVLHIGKYLDLEKEVAFENIKKSVSEVLYKTPDDVKVIFENTAGQGTEVGFKFEELGRIYDLFSVDEKRRIGFCLDTCHSHAAGYDLSSSDGVRVWIDEFEKYIGWGKVVCIHLNDAQKEAGSRVDRHADLLEGTIGEEGFRSVVKFAYAMKVPLILETPAKSSSYEEQIKLVKSWV